MLVKADSILFLEQSEIDKSRWDKSVKEANNSLIYAYSWYLDVVSPGWCAMVSHDYSELWPLPKSHKWGIEYIYQPFFTQQLGLISKNNITSSRVEFFWKKILKKFNYAHIHLNIQNPKLGYEFEIKRITHLLDLYRTYEDISKGYNENLRRNIKKAIKSDVEIFPDGDKTLLVSWLKKDYHQYFKGIKEKHYQILKKLINELEKRKSCFIYTARINKEDIAMGLFLKKDKQLIYLIGVNSDKGKKTGAMHFIFDQIIRQYAKTEVYLDFEGSMVPSIAQFFKSFGANEREFYQWHYNALPWPLNKLKK